MALLLLAGFLGAALLVYGPALDGPFLSDDQHYVQANPYVHGLTRENLRTILDPYSVLTLVVENYAPVHLLLHALEWEVFGEAVRGYHVVNVVLHALSAVLLVWLFVQTGIPLAAAAAGGLVFLVHPANVEAVAWISQLKSSSAMALSLGALLAHPRRPLLGAALFGLALLAKPSALYALPVAAALGWVRDAPARDAGEAPGWRWGWLGVWAGLLAAFSVVELTAFAQTAGRAPPLYADVWVQLRSSVAIALRYLVMAVTSYGLSTFHEPEPVTSWLDPTWLAALGVLGLLAGRALAVARRRRLEAAYWVWAAAAFAPVSGLLRLPFPMADRYLYFILPGLIGAALLAGSDALARLQASGRVQVTRRAATALVGVAGVAFVLGMAVRAHARAGIWRSAHTVMADSELHYPEGVSAKTRQATRAARRGDVDAAMQALRDAHRRGYNRLDHILQEPAYAVLRDDPRFRALLVEIADEMLERLGRNPAPSQLELHVMALAHSVRGDRQAALRALERALEVGGPKDDVIRTDLEAMRRQLRLERATDPGTRPPGT